MRPIVVSFISAALSLFGFPAFSQELTWNGEIQASNFDCGPDYKAIVISGQVEMSGSADGELSQLSPYISIKCQEMRFEPGSLLRINKNVEIRLFGSASGPINIESVTDIDGWPGGRNEEGGKGGTGASIRLVTGSLLNSSIKIKAQGGSGGRGGYDGSDAKSVIGGGGGDGGNVEIICRDATIAAITPFVSNEGGFAGPGGRLSNGSYGLVGRPGSKGSVSITSIGIISNDAWNALVR
ncbi:hypothetical protein [Rhizobium sp. BK060]|uniref:hypothetical protein n=1 Tax=Rhizobium sp. BK060 TaxID=2587096 RepID=UPI00161590AA|nr:hypothetical protein [Rhizobium sp. BK060]MBB3399701.1 hypothetical protein [Rhizobium sp. BK060]